MTDDIANGDHCRVAAGTHKGKSGIVADRNTSKTGNVTTTVTQADGSRFKTLPETSRGTRPLRPNLDRAARLA